MLQINFTGYRQEILLKGKPFPAKIYRGKEQLVEGFNVYCITLDASERSLLHWNEQIKLAQTFIEKGFFILWELDFALEESLLDDEALFLTLQLNVHHFNDIIWNFFKENTFGVSLFCGNLKEELARFVKALGASLNADASCFIFLDLKEPSISSFLKVLSLEMLGALCPIVKSPLARRYPFCAPFIAWDGCSSPLGFCSDKQEAEYHSTRVSHAICVPDHIQEDLLVQAVEFLGALPFHFIEENKLHEEWEGIDKLIVLSYALNEKLKRKLAGFRAAGGEVIMFPDDAA